jgi:hypothetical protein
MYVMSYLLFILIWMMIQYQLSRIGIARSLTSGQQEKQTEARCFDLPDNDPIGNIMEMAIMHHELFSSYVRVGFSETQALRLIGYIIASGAQGDDEAEPPRLDDHGSS